MDARGGVVWDEPTNSGMPDMSHGAAIVPLLRLYSPRPPARRDWNELRKHVDLAKVALELLGLPVERRGLRTISQYWHCPFELARVPSFRVNAAEPSWACFACGAGGDAAALVMRIKGISFRDAIAWLDEHGGFNSTELRGVEAEPARPAIAIR
jgi:DNA primase